MKLDFFKKINKSAKNDQKPFSKPFSEIGPSPKFLWNIVLTIYFFVTIFVIIFVFFSYSFLTRDRVGVADTGATVMPKVNLAKIEKVNTFFNERLLRIENVYTEKIINPGLK